MINLIALFFGTAVLMHWSVRCFPWNRRLRDNQKSWRQTDVFLVAAALWIACFCFLRETYNDTATYIDSFQKSESTAEFLANGGLRDLTGNPLFYLYRCLVRDVTDNYHLFFLLPGLMVGWSCVHFIRRYSTNPVMSVVIFFSLGTVVTLMTAMKQGMATAILLFAIPCAIDGKYIRFYLLVALATLFHTYAIVFALVPLLFGKPWNLVTVALLGLTFFCLATFESTLGAFISYAQSVGAHAAEEDVFSNTQINFLRVAVYLIPGLFALLFRDRLFHNSTRIENLFVNMSIISSFILVLGLADGANVLARAAAYYEIGTAVALPWMLKKIFSRFSARTISLLAAGLFVTFFLYEFVVAKNFDAQYSAISLWEFMVGLFS